MVFFFFAKLMINIHNNDAFKSKLKWHSSSKRELNHWYILGVFGVFSFADAIPCQDSPRCSTSIT